MEWSVIIERDIAWDRLEATQADLIERVRENPSRAFLLVSEPRPTFTHGRFARPEDCLWSPEELARESVVSYPVSRGGKWTFHGPGQIVIYPIVALRSLNYSRHAVHQFLATLRGSVAESLRELGLETEPGDHPFGLYVRGRKLVSFGIAVERGIALHGLALYYRDQSHFMAGIRPCGMEAAQVTSLADHGVDLEWEVIAQSMTKWIKKGF